MLYWITVSLINPFLLTVLGLGILLICARKRLSRRLNYGLWLAYAGFLLWSNPIVSHLSVGSLEWSYPPPSHEQIKQVDAIVVLSGGMWPPDSFYPRGRLTNGSIRRCITGSEVYQLQPSAIVIISGGIVGPRMGPPEAELMGELVTGLGVPPEKLVLETSSQSTFENAVESAKLLKQHRCERIALVTSASHLMRSVACFRKQGIEVLPVGSHYESVDFFWSLTSLFPNTSAIRRNQSSLHEWIGWVWYKMNGRV